MIKTILIFVLLGAPPKFPSWLGVTLVKEGTCLRVAGLAKQGPYSRAGGQLNQCIVRIAGRDVTDQEGASAIVSTQPDGQTIEIETSTAAKFRARVERQPSNAAEQICLGTTEQQVVVSILADGSPKPRHAIYRAPISFGELVRNEQLLPSTAVVLRTCSDQNGRLIEHPSPDLRINFGSTLLVAADSNKPLGGSPLKKGDSKSAEDPAL